MGDANRCTYTEMGLRALYEIATLPSDERDRPHMVPSSGQAKRLDEMTVRELREVVRDSVRNEVGRRHTLYIPRKCAKEAAGYG